MKKCVILIVFIITLLLPACTSDQTEMQDGYYTAEEVTFGEFGWKEYLTIYVNNNKIVTVEYNAKNASGLIKSWDMDYMRAMNAVSGTYPNKFMREYAEGLLNKQDPLKVDAISGATESYLVFEQLSKAAIAQAMAGDKKVAFVNLEEE